MSNTEIQLEDGRDLGVLIPAKLNDIRGQCAHPPNRQVTQKRMPERK